MTKPTVLENKVVSCPVSRNFFEEDTKTPAEDFIENSIDKIHLPFELSPEDVQMIEELAVKEKIPYRFAVQNVLRNALDLYHKFVLLRSGNNE